MGVWVGGLEICLLKNNPDGFVVPLFSSVHLVYIVPFSILRVFPLVFFPAFFIAFPSLYFLSRSLCVETGLFVLVYG